MITAADAPMANLATECGIDIILVGDSMAMTVLGYETTLPLTIDESLHHTAAVRRGAPKAFIVGDMPFMTYQAGINEALINAARYLKEAKADAVKIEGGMEVIEVVARFTGAGIPVMGHIGLQPQKVMTSGGYRIAGKSDSEIKKTLKLGANAYSTLRSRLNVKVQNYLISKSDAPKVDVLSKLMSIDDIVFNQKAAIALTTLKRLERELIRYDLSNELTTVYKYLKKLHLNTNEYFHYSQLYYRHIAYSLALDKAEDILARYFKEYGFYYAMGLSSKKLELAALFEEMKNVCALYQSHRMFVYLAALEIFHRLFVDEEALDKYKLEPIEESCWTS